MHLSPSLDTCHLTKGFQSYSICLPYIVQTRTHMSSCCHPISKFSRFFQVWFQNRRAKFRKTERMSQHSGGSKNSENESGNRTPGSPGGNGEHGDKSADTSDISVDNIKEEKGSHLPQHGSPLEALSNKSRNDTLEGKKIEKKSEIKNSQFMEKDC